MPNWQEVLREIGGEVATHQQRAQGAVDTVRRKYLAKLRDKTGRHVIAYYSAFLSKPEIVNSRATKPTIVISTTTNAKPYNSMCR